MPDRARFVTCIHQVSFSGCVVYNCLSDVFSAGRRPVNFRRHESVPVGANSRDSEDAR